MYNKPTIQTRFRTFNRIFDVKFSQSVMQKYFIILGLLFYSLSLTSQQLLTPEEAVAIALDNNYSIKITKTRIKIAEANNTRGNAGQLPTITGTVGKNYLINNTQLQFFDEKIPIINRKGVQNNTGNAGIGVVWTLFDGMGMFIAKDQLGTLKLVAENNAKAIINNMVAQVLSVYHDVVRGERRVENLKKGLEISNDRLKLSKER